MTDQTKVLTPIDGLKKVLDADSVKTQMANAMADNAPLFISSLIDLYSGDNYLQKCAPGKVVMEALKAATLKLPINKSLGFAYIVPYNKSIMIDGKWQKEMIPQMQIGWRGFVQLAMRTGSYKFINADVIYKGEMKGYDKLTGELDLKGKKESDEIIGYFAYIETVNGFKKTIYGSVDDIESHAKRYSESYKADLNKPEGKRKSAWHTNFDEMALKTLIKQVLSKYGIMSVEMVSAFTADHDDKTQEQSFNADVAENANEDFIDIDTTTGEVKEPEETQPEY